MGLKKGQCNNPNGRPRVPEIELIRNAIDEVSKEKKKTLWKHLIEQCFEDNVLLGHVSKKFMPDVTIQKNVDEDGKVIPYSIIINTITKKNSD